MRYRRFRRVRSDSQRLRLATGDREPPQLAAAASRHSYNNFLSVWHPGVGPGFRWQTFWLYMIQGQEMQMMVAKYLGKGQSLTVGRKGGKDVSHHLFARGRQFMDFAGVQRD